MIFKWLVEDGTYDLGAQSVMALRAGPFRNAVAVLGKKWKVKNRIEARQKLKCWVKAIKPGKKYRMLRR